MKITFEEFYLTDDRNEILLRLDDVEKLLQQTYWAQARSRELIIKSIENSICYAVIDTSQDTLVAFARVITDYAVRRTIKRSVWRSTDQGRSGLLREIWI